ncbi:S8 family peptidase [Micromonospora rubida]|uniref:S8 family peptidase n=1 Tax=Micromonospora rubida TaxID=2697657 RepID=UPI0013771F00|nr:S8 family serine peptidase [Micromonospora rubida]NBE83302.1 S8 family serine peptidase [Micromonospora rubida]
MSHRRWRSRDTIVGVSVLGLVLSGAAPATARPDLPTVPAAVPAVVTPTGAAPAGVAPGARRVTLITGDVVHYQVDKEGTPRVTLEPALRSGRGAMSFLQVRDGDSYFVYPSDAMPLVDAGKLDRALFDVDYLVDNGYTDDLTDELPVIAQYGTGARSAKSPTASTLKARAEALPANTDVAALPSVGGAGFDVTKKQAGDFWAAVAGAQSGAGARASTLGAGLTKLWLDQRVYPTLDRSVAQIGAPEAWKVGLDGTGVKVAVLDSGIDLNHPDFGGGRIVAAVNHTSTPSIHDNFGHGTHVASIIAGSGAASNGKYRGVAPGASLMVGKVLGDYGTGSTRNVIAGMEWAAAAGADIVNMSLGGGGDHTSPQSVALNNLTSQYGTLFVVAGGNSGPNPQTLGAPGVAEAALTVAAVDRDDKTASFSSRGPRRLDHGLKPDISAPGVGIVAARSEPSIMGGAAGERYLAANGTSMAAPHVAGAAAILGQQHPDWAAKQLKPVLVSTAKDTGSRAYEQGAGRVDVARAVRQQVYATNSLDFGLITYGQTAASSRTVSYVNNSTTPVTLRLTATLSTDKGNAPAGMLTLDRETVTVPANGTADVTATVHPAAGSESTWYEGALRASAEGIEVGTAIGLYKEPQSFQVTGKLILPDGVDPAYFYPGNWVFARTDGRKDRGGAVLGGAETETTARVYGGEHAVAVLVDWFDSDGRNSAIAMQPEFDVTEDTTVTLDLRKLRKITVDTPKGSDNYQMVFGALRLGANNYGGVQGSAMARPADGWDGWLLPTKPVRQGVFQAFSQHLLGAPQIAMSVRGPRGLDLHPRYQAADAVLPKLDGRRTLPVVYAGTGTTEDFAAVDAKGKLVLLDLSDACPLIVCGEEVATRVGNAAQAGAAAVLGFGKQGHVMIGDTTWPVYSIPTMSIPVAEARTLLGRLKGGAVSVNTSGTAVSPYRYVLAFPELGRVPQKLTYRVTDRQVYRIDNRFHSDAPATVSQVWSAQHADMLVSAVTRAAPRRAQSTVTEYVGPISGDVLWNRTADYTYDEPVNGVQYGPAPWANEIFTKPGRRTEAWNSQPLATGPHGSPANVLAHPWGAVACYTCRAGDTMVFDTLSLDQAGHSTQGRPGEWTLSRDGQEIPVKERGYLVSAIFFLLRIPVDTFDVPAEAGRYRLTHTATALNPQQRYATKEDAVYTFRSQRPTAETADFASCMGQTLLGRAELCQAEQILRLRYNTEVDLANQAVAGRSQEITIGGHYGNGLAAPKLRSLKMWVSTDDGANWKSVKVDKHNGKFSGRISHPKLEQTTGAVSIRVHAVDENGSTVEQTLHRAYGLRSAR